MTEQEIFEERFIEILEGTKGYSEFNKWLNNWPAVSVSFCLKFRSHPLPVQKGVFEEFIRWAGCIIEQDYDGGDSIPRWSIYHPTQKFIAYHEPVRDAILKFMKNFKFPEKIYDDEKGNTSDEFPEFVSHH